MSDSVVLIPKNVEGNSLSTSLESEKNFHYLRFYSAHVGRFGNEYIEFELKSNGILRYENTTNYRKEGLIRKEVKLSNQLVEFIRDLIINSGVMELDDKDWPYPDSNARQDLEIHVGNTEISFLTNILSLQSEVSSFPEELKINVFYDFIRDLKQILLTIISVHFKLKGASFNTI